MNAKPFSKANAFDILFQNVWFRMMYWLFWAAYLTVFWFVLGPNSRAAAHTFPWYAVSVVWATGALVPALPAPAVVRWMPPRWFHVPAGERVVHRVLGVGVFGRLLNASGWNRRILEPLRGFSGTRADLPLLEQGVRASAVSHGICFAIHALLAVLVLFSRYPRTGALWMLLPGVAAHLYPVLLQRSTMLRLQPLLDKAS